MRTYVAPHYECENINANDIILTSAETMPIVQLNKNNAQVSASIWEILGNR